MNNLRIDKYSVAYNFTAVMKEAFQYALQRTHTRGGEVLLGRISKHEKDTSVPERKLNNIISKLSSQDQERTSYKVIVGSIFDQIDKMAQLIETSVIVIRAHAAYELQKVLGSNILKLVSASGVQLILTQENKKKTEIDDIVMRFCFKEKEYRLCHVPHTSAKAHVHYSIPSCKK